MRHLDEAVSVTVKVKVLLEVEHEVTYPTEDWGMAVNSAVEDARQAFGATLEELGCRWLDVAIEVEGKGE